MIDMKVTKVFGRLKKYRREFIGATSVALLIALLVLFVMPVQVSITSEGFLSVDFDISFGIQQAYASPDDTGATYPGTAATEAVSPEDDQIWVNFNNIKADDGNVSYAEADYQYSYRLKATNFGFSLPDGATIDGILVEIEGRRTGAAINAKDYRVQLLDADGVLVGDNKADTITIWPTTLTIANYGGATDTWNAMPTEAMVESANFGVVLSVSLPANTLNRIQVDFIRMTIYYTVAGCTEDISNTPDTWSVNGGSPVSASSNYSTGLTYFTVTNNSGGAVDITISGTDMTGGGYTWDLADDGNPGDMTYALKAGLSGGDYTIIVRETATYNTLVSGLDDGLTQDWGLKLWTPTVMTNEGNAKSGIVTITAVCN